MAKSTDKKKGVYVTGTRLACRTREGGEYFLESPRHTQFPSNCSTLIFHGFGNGGGDYLNKITHANRKELIDRLEELAHEQGGYTYAMVALLRHDQTAWIESFRESGWKDVPELTGINHRTGNSLVTLVHSTENPGEGYPEDIEYYDDDDDPYDGP